MKYGMRVTKNEVIDVLWDLLPAYRGKIDFLVEWRILLEIAIRRLFMVNDQSLKADILRQALKQIDNGEELK